MLCVPKVLLLTGEDRDAVNLQAVLGNHAFLNHARSISEMQGRLERGDCDLLLCSWAFYQGFWNGAIQEVRERYPDLPVVILSRTGGEEEWMEVLEAGAFDLLAVPCESPTLMAVVEQAVASHEARKARKFAVA